MSAGEIFPSGVRHQHRFLRSRGGRSDSSVRPCRLLRSANGNLGPSHIIRLSAGGRHLGQRGMGVNLGSHDFPGQRCNTIVLAFNLTTGQALDKRDTPPPNPFLGPSGGTASFPSSSHGHFCLLPNSLHRLVLVVQLPYPGCTWVPYILIRSSLPPWKHRIGSMEDGSRRILRNIPNPILPRTPGALARFLTSVLRTPGSPLVDANTRNANLRRVCPGTKPRAGDRLHPLLPFGRLMKRFTRLELVVHDPHRICDD